MRYSHPSTLPEGFLKKKIKRERKSKGKRRIPLKTSLKLLLTAEGRELMQRKHVEPWRHEKQTLLESPKD